MHLELHSIKDGEDFTSCGGTIPAVSSHRTTSETNFKFTGAIAASFASEDATLLEPFEDLGSVAFAVLLRCSSARLKVASGELRGGKFAARASRVTGEEQPDGI